METHQYHSYLAAKGLTSLVQEAIGKNLYEGILVGETGTQVELLQFADDTLFTCKPSIQNVCTIKAILRCFELTSDLRMNFHKSQVGAGGVRD